MSKISMPRPRYIAFRMTGPSLSRRAVANAIRARGKEMAWTDAGAPQLTRYAWPDGIVRVEHTDVARARELLVGITRAVENGGPVAVVTETLATSGTLKALTTKTGVLTERDAPPSRTP